jgi:hypothetical protein
MHTPLAGLFALLAATAVSAQGTRVDPSTQHAAAVARLNRQASEIFDHQTATPAKAQLIQIASQLRDSLDPVDAALPRIARAQSSGMTAVVIASGRGLVRDCQRGVGMAKLTTQRVSGMSTSDPRGDQALANYLASLGRLTAQLERCRHDDSAAVARRPPDAEQIQATASTVSDAVQAYEAARVALFKVLQIDMPIHGYHPAPRH